MRVSRIFLLVVVGALTYLIFLLATFPAAQAYAWFGRGLPVEAYGLSGTVWSGRAAVAIVEGERLEDVQWDLRRGQLLRARLSSDVSARLLDGRLSGHLNMGRKDVALTNVRLEMPASQLVALSGVTVPARLEGRFDISMREVRIDNGRLTTADGIVTWQQGVVHLLRRPLPLGDVNLRLQPAEGGEIHGVLMNDNGPLDIAGQLQLRPDSQLVADLTVRALEGAEEQAGDALRLLGIPSDGSPVRSRLTGALDGSAPMRLHDVD